jgi:hypothetical protein
MGSLALAASTAADPRRAETTPSLHTTEQPFSAVVPFLFVCSRPLR